MAEGRRATGWTLGAWAAMQVAALVLTRNALALLVVQATIAEWGAGKLAVTWSDPLAPPPAVSAVARRFGLGAAWGFAGAACVAGVGWAARQASIGPATPAVGALLLGAVPALLGAVRDELLLRGMVLRIGRSLLGPVGAIVLCGCCAAAARAGAAELTVLAVCVEGFRGIALALVWNRDRGAWMALGANAAWTWALDSLLRGGLVDVRMAVEPGASAAALVVVIAFGALAARWGWASVPKP